MTNKIYFKKEYRKPRIKSRKEERKPRAYRSLPKGSKQLPEMDCPFCFKAVNDTLYACQFNQHCPLLLRIQNSLSMRIQLDENLVFGFWVSEAPGILEGDYLENPYRERNMGGSHMWGIPWLILERSGLWALGSETAGGDGGAPVLWCDHVNSVYLGKWHRHVICLPWWHLTDLHSISISATWAYRLYKQSDSLSLVTVISKVADGSEQGYIFCHTMKHECIPIQAHFY